MVYRRAVLNINYKTGDDNVKRFISIITLSIIFIILIGCSSTKEDYQLSTKEKVEDFEYMYQVVKEGYPYLEVNKRLNNVDWLSNKEEYLDSIKNTANDEEFLKQMTEILMDLNNGHTYIINDENSFNFIKSVYSQADWYDFLDNKKVVNRYKSIGASSEDINNIMVKKDVIAKDVIDGKVGYMHLPQMYTVSDGITKSDIESDMKIIGDYINALEDNQALIIDIRENSGGDDTYWRNIVSKITSKPIEQKGYLALRNESEIIESYLNKRGFTVNSIENLPKELLNNAPKEVMADFNVFSELKVYIEENNASKFEGNIYLLVDEAVYSSSESLDIFCKDIGFATLIGEKLVEMVEE